MAGSRLVRNVLECSWRYALWRARFQVLMVCLSCWLFGTTLTGLNILGVALVVAGSLWYSMAAASPPNKVCSPTGAAEDNLHTVKVVNNQ